MNLSNGLTIKKKKCIAIYLLIIFKNNNEFHFDKLFGHWQLGNCF